MSNLNTHSMESTTAVLETFNMKLGVKRYLQICIITGMFYYSFYIICSIIKNELLNNMKKQCFINLMFAKTWPQI